MVTLTLVDLYISQGYQDKALDVLEKLISLNPDLNLKRRFEEFESSYKKTAESKLEEPSKNLPEEKEFSIIKGRMNSFLEGLKRRADQYREA